MLLVNSLKFKGWYCKGLPHLIHNGAKTWWRLDARNGGASTTTIDWHKMSDIKPGARPSCEKHIQCAPATPLMFQWPAHLWQHGSCSILFVIR